MKGKGVRRKGALNWRDSHYSQLSTWLGEVKPTYLTWLDAVDQGGIWVPLTPAGTHDALKQKFRKQETLGLWKKWSVACLPHQPTLVLQRQESFCVTGKHLVFPLGANNPAGSRCEGRNSKSGNFVPPSSSSSFPRISHFSECCWYYLKRPSPYNECDLFLGRMLIF